MTIQAFGEQLTIMPFISLFDLQMDAHWFGCLNSVGLGSNLVPALSCIEILR